MRKSVSKSVVRPYLSAARTSTLNTETLSDVRTIKRECGETSRRDGGATERVICFLLVATGLMESMESLKKKVYLQEGSLRLSILTRSQGTIIIRAKVGVCSVGVCSHLARESTQRRERHL
jgi:hypothetical protein